MAQARSDSGVVQLLADTTFRRPHDGVRSPLVEQALGPEGVRDNPGAGKCSAAANAVVADPTVRLVVLHDRTVHQMPLDRAVDPKWARELLAFHVVAFKADGTVADFSHAGASAERIASGDFAVVAPQQQQGVLEEIFKGFGGIEEFATALVDDSRRLGVTGVTREEAEERLRQAVTFAPQTALDFLGAHATLGQYVVPGTDAAPRPN